MLSIISLMPLPLAAGRGHRLAPPAGPAAAQGLNPVLVVACVAVKLLQHQSSIYLQRN
jgi:hypothetical protein